MIKNLVICGDSFMSPVTSDGFKGTHFAEIIAKELNYNLISLSMGGMSNGGICVQLNTALAMSQKPDLILLNNTHPTRFEWPVNETRKLGDGPWNISATDLLYAQPESLSKTYKWLNKNPKIVSYAIDRILVENSNPNADMLLHRCINDDKYKTERIHALKEFFMYLYHPDMKEFTDSLMFMGMLYMLHASNIPYIILKDKLPNLIEKCKFVGEKNYAGYRINNIPNGDDTPNYKDPGYHSTIEHQNIVADILLKEYIPYVIK